MDDISKITYNALTKYYDYLGYTGYMSDNLMNLLILCMFIEEFVKDYKDYFLDDDLIVVLNVLNCLYSNSCLITWDGCGFPTINID